MLHTHLTVGNRAAEVGSHRGIGQEAGLRTVAAADLAHRTAAAVHSRTAAAVAAVVVAVQRMGSPEAVVPDRTHVVLLMAGAVRSCCTASAAVEHTAAAAAEAVVVAPLLAPDHNDTAAVGVTALVEAQEQGSLFG